MNKLKTRTMGIIISVLLISASSAAFSKEFKKSTTLDALIGIDGAQALVAAVLVVDDGSIVNLLSGKKPRFILFAPTNSAFESLLGLDAGALDGLTIEQIEAALPGLLPPGVGPAEVREILLQHVSVPDKYKEKNVSIEALMKQGSVVVVDEESTLPVGIGGEGNRINYESNVTKSNLYTRNGVIHFVDSVIVDDALDL